MFLLACGAAAIVVAAAAQIAMPARGSPVVAWVTCVFLPGFIIAAIGLAGRRRRLLLVVTGLIYVEAILLAALYAVGMAFAILLPMIAIGIVQPHLGRSGRVVLYGTAVVVATASVVIVELGVPTNPLGADYPGLAVIAFALVAAFALGLTWHAAEQLTEALTDAESEIDARVAAERSARESADAFEQLVRSSAVATIVLDPDGRVSVWNRAAGRLFGQNEADVLGRPLPLRSGVDDGSSLLRRLLTTEVIEGDTVEVKASTRTALVEIHSAPRIDEDGSRRGTIVQLVDVTERTALEAQLRQAQKMEAIGHVAGGIAHDINNTLTAVGGFAELIAAETEQASIRRDAETIAAAARRAAELTSRLLTFARRSVLQPQVIDIGHFLISLQPILQRLLGEDVDVEIVDDAPGAAVNVDPGQLEQALLNLAVNARDAMPSGGRLTISVARGDLRLPTGPPRPAVVVAVTDTGHGIPAAIQDRVWEPFFTTKERGRGTGLGLAMVYGFVTQSGGLVSLRSEENAGATIAIELPEEEVEPRPPTPSEAIVAGAVGGQETILVIEDEHAIAELGRRVLGGLGYRVLVAANGAEAVEIANADGGSIDLVLADVIMPGMTGPEAAAAVRQVHPEAAVLYVSGFTADAIAHRGVLPPGVDLLAKPYTFEELARRVRSALDARGPGQRDQPRDEPRAEPRDEPPRDEPPREGAEGGSEL